MRPPTLSVPVVLLVLVEGVLGVLLRALLVPTEDRVLMADPSRR
jgi:hypothetical protein